MYIFLRRDDGEGHKRQKVRCVQKNEDSFSFTLSLYFFCVGRMNSWVGRVHPPFALHFFFIIVITTVTIIVVDRVCILLSEWWRSGGRRLLFLDFVTLSHITLSIFFIVRHHSFGSFFFLFRAYYYYCVVHCFWSVFYGFFLRTQFYTIMWPIIIKSTRAFPFWRWYWYWRYFSSELKIKNDTNVLLCNNNGHKIVKWRERLKQWKKDIFFIQKTKIKKSKNEKVTFCQKQIGNIFLRVTQCLCVFCAYLSSM